MWAITKKAHLALPHTTAHERVVVGRGVTPGHDRQTLACVCAIFLDPGGQPIDSRTIVHSLCRQNRPAMADMCVHVSRKNRSTGHSGLRSRIEIPAHWVPSTHSRSPALSPQLWPRRPQPLRGRVHCTATRCIGHTPQWPAERSRRKAWRPRTPTPAGSLFALAPPSSDFWSRPARAVKNSAALRVTGLRPG